MQIIEMYVEVEYHGRADAGQGKYIGILETMVKTKNGKEEPATLKVEGGLINTTKNRLLITAVNSGLMRLVKPCEVHIHINSRYIADSIEQHDVYRWQQSGWMRRNEPVKNADLWEELMKQLEKHLVTVEDTKEHNYSMWMRTNLPRLKVELKEDRRNEDV